jgi:hypothetical protein
MGKTHKTISEAQQDVEELYKVVVKPLNFLQTLNNKENVDEEKIEKEKIEMKKSAALIPNVTPQPFLNMSLAEQLKIDKEALKSAFERLYTRWCSPKSKLSRTGGYRAVTDVLLKNLNDPLTFSMLIGSVEHFRKYFQEDRGDIFCFEFCCLCGAENIINEIYLKDDTRIKCLILSENAIAYALSSDNEKLAILLAEKAINLGKKDPGNINLYALGNHTATKKIQEIFTPTKKNNLSP